MIPSALYAQEIVENQINENKEAQLRKNSVETGTHENEIKSDLNLKETNPSFGTAENLLVLRSKVISKNAFSYTQNCNIPNKTKPPLLPKPKNRQRSSCETMENETSNLAQNLHSCINIDSKSIDSNKTSSISSDLPRTFTNSTKNHHLEDNIKLEDTVPPPLPSRPPPVFKYPLGTFYKETNELNETKANKEHQKLSKSLPIESCLSDQIAKKISTNDMMIAERCQENVPLNNKIRPTDSLSEIRKNKPDLELLCQETLQSTSAPVEKFPKFEELNAHSKKLKTNPDVIQKRSISIPLGIQENKPPKPLPRPHINKDKSDNISGVFPKRSISIPLEINQALLLDLELNRKKCLAQKTKDSQASKKPNVPSKPDSLIHQRSEHIMVEQKLREQEYPISRLPIEKKITERSKTEWSQENKSQTTSSSSIGFDSHASKSENSLSFENTTMDSSSAAELREEQSKSDLNQDHIADFSVFHSLNRPTLPQKMKSSQRSLSYTSIVQTVKDIGATIWNPSDKVKRNSTGMKITEAPRQTTDMKVSEDKRSPEEEKAAIIQSAWFHDISATEAQNRLLKLDQDGAFLIRPTSRPTDNIQYTASITYAGRVFNIHIRRKANHCYALGKEKEGEKSFQRLSDLIKYYQDMPFDIHPVGSSEPHAICFRVTPSR